MATDLESPPADTSDSIDAFLTWDHDRLDGLFDDARELANAGDAAEAAKPFDTFLRGLMLHIMAEEDILFPVYDRGSGLRGMGPTSMMRAEHNEIRALLDAMSKALKGQDLETFQAGASDLEDLLSMHNDKEEQVLYPSLDELVNKEGRMAELMKRTRKEMGF